MKILRGHILAELVWPFLISLGVVTFVLLAGNLLKQADVIINRGVNLGDVLQLFGYLALGLSTHTLPIAFVTSILFAFARLTTDQEITAMKACGISVAQIIAPVIAAGMVLSVLCIPLNDRLIPFAHFGLRHVIKQIGLKQPTAYIEPGTFIKEFDRYIIFIYGVHRNKLSNIRIYEPQPNGPTRTIIAREGELFALPGRDALTLRLIDGTSDEPNPKDPETVYKLRFSTYEMTLDLDTFVKGAGLKKRSKDMTVAELHQEIRAFQKDHIDVTPLRTEAHLRIATSWANFAMALIVLPLAVQGRRTQERARIFVIGILVLTTYWLLLLAGTAFGLRGILPPPLAVWFPNGLFAATGLMLCWRAQLR